MGDTKTEDELDIDVEPIDLRLHPDVDELPHRSDVTTRRVNSRKTTLVVADLLVVAVSLFTASTLNRWVNPNDPLGTAEYLAFSMLSLPMWAALFTQQGLYRARLVSRGIDEISRLLKAVGMGFVGLGVLSILFKVTLGRRWLFLAVAIVGTAIVVERMVARYLFKRARRNGRNMRRVVIIGRNTEARLVREMLEADPALGYEVTGFVDEILESEPGESQLSVVGNPHRVLEAVRRSDSIGVIIAATAIDIGTSNRLIRVLTENGIHVELSSTLCDIASDRVSIRPLGRIPMMYIEPVHRNGWRALAKRTFDVCVAAISLVVLAPLIAVCALLIKVTSSGPVLFRQVRVGRDGQPFEVLKLRTMVADAEARRAELDHLNEANGPIFKMRDDPRITKIGKLLRKTSIDELPQLVNVLRSEMSLVGPRPALPSEVADWETSLHNRLRVKPGITGMWQVNGRASADEGDYGQLDLYYVDNWSLLADMAILVRTIPAVLTQRGAC